MELELKKLSLDGVAPALAKAERYRLLNEPAEAESICLDILDVDANNQQAMIALLLSLTDQFGQNRTRLRKRAVEIIPRLNDEYERNYYSGLICERMGKAIIAKWNFGAVHDAYEWLHDALEWYEKSEALRSDGNDEVVLRWNHCLRTIREHNLQPRPKDEHPGFLE